MSISPALAVEPGSITLPVGRRLFWREYGAPRGYQAGRTLVAAALPDCTARFCPNADTRWFRTSTR